MIFRLLPVLLILGALFVVPNAEANHDNNDFFVLDGPFPAQLIRGTSTNVWAIPNSFGQIPVQVYHRVSANVWQPYPHGLDCDNGNGGLSVVSPTSVYFVCARSLLSDNVPTQNDFSHWTGTTFVTSDVPVLDFTWDIWAFSDSDIWVTGYNRTTDTVYASHSTTSGATWSNTALYSAPNFDIPGCMFGLASNNLYAIRNAASPRIWHYDGSTWSDIGAGPGPNMGGSTPCPRSWYRPFWGTASNNLYASSGATIYRSTTGGTSWTALQTLGGDIHSIHGSSATNIWVTEGALWHSTDGLTFTNTNPASPVTDPGQGVIVFSATDIYFGAGSVASQGQGVYAYSAVAAAGAPVLTGLSLDRDDFNVETSQAQCNLDEVTLRIETDVTIGAGGINWWVINSDDSVVVETGTSAAFFGINNHVFHTSRAYETGEYLFIATVDAQGALAADLFSSWGFSVPRGTCVDSADQDLIPFLQNHFIQTDSYVNTTATTTRSLVNTTHSHLDSHFNTTWIRISDLSTIANQTRSDVLHNHDELHNILGNNFTCANCTLEPMSIIDLPGLSDEQVGMLLILFFVFVFSLLQKPVARGGPGPFWIVAVFATVGLGAIFVAGTGWGFVTAFLAIIIGFWLEVFVRNRGTDTSG